MQHNKIIEACQEFLHLPQAEPVTTYLNNRLSKTAQEKFLFGYFPTYNELHLLVDKVGEDILTEHHLLYKKFVQDGILQRSEIHCTLEQHNLIIPFYNVYNELVAIVGRTISSEEERKAQKLAKYKNTSFNKGHNLFNLNNAKQDILKKDYVIIVEGQFDCISASDKGLPNTVALGSSNMTWEQLALITRYTTNLKLLLDSDEAGQEGERRIVETFGKYAKIEKISLPSGFKDVDDFLKDNSVEDLGL